MPKLVPIAFLACLALPALADTRPPHLQLPTFTHLQEQAVESVDIDVGPLPIAVASWFMNESDHPEADIKGTLKAVKSVRVRHYKFASDFVYSKADIDGVRSQLSDKGWSPLAQVRNRKTQEDVDVYLALEKKNIKGLAIVISEPREFTIVNVVGNLKPEQIARLREEFAPDSSATHSPVEPSSDL